MLRKAMLSRLLRARTLLLALSSVAPFGCGGAEPQPNQPANPRPTSQESVQSAHKSYAAKPVRFENLGGMWMPHQMAAHEAKLKELGLTLDPRELTDPTSKTLQAVVSLGGCSASFVSADGLVITNHHCAVGALQMNSTPAQNLLKDGFLARTRNDERSNGPTARVFVTDRVTDITEAIRKDLAATKDAAARYKLVEDRQKQKVAECEKGRAGVRCSVGAFYEGAKYYLIEQLEIRDVRLVMAPHAGIGNYGGEIDNWRWPRHTGDYSFFRAYVGKDGKPADYSPDNVPFKPKSFLRVTETPLREGDLVFVAGYPGRTYSLKTKAEVEDAVTFGYPRRQKLCEDYLAALEPIAKEDPAVAIVATPFVRRYGNALTNTKGQLDGLVKDGLLAIKSAREDQLRAYVDADPERKARYAKVLNEIAKVAEDNKKNREADAELGELLTPKLLSAAHLIVKMAEERGKPDAARDPEVQERNWPRVRQSLEAMDKQYHAVVDRVLLETALARANKVPAAERSAAVAITEQHVEAGKKRLAQTSMGFTKGAALYVGTELGTTAKRVELFDKAKLSDLRASKDPLIQWALAIRPLVKAMELRDHKTQGKLLVLKDQYFTVLREHEGKEIAPDANGTLRITYGTVRGYRTSSSTPIGRPFTMLSEVVAKSTGKEPFDAPRALLDAFVAKKFAGYTDSETNDEVPVDFLADLHITGGNSGSATFNAKGELTGLVFDGNYEALASDWLFKPETTRSIHVDSRYVRWTLDAVYHANELLEELRTPAKL